MQVIETKEKNGRPTSWKAEYVELVEGLSLLGLKDVDLAKHFEIDVSTLGRWKIEREGFRAAIKRGRQTADIEVVKALKEKATGYEKNEVWYPQDTGAMAFWLKNRHPEIWRDRHEVVQTTTTTHRIALESPELARRLLSLMGRVEPKVIDLEPLDGPNAEASNEA